MINHPLSTDLQKFIARHIHSVEQLEILCLFVESPGKAWSDAEVYRCIQSSQNSVSEKLHYFAQEGILARDPEATYRLSSSSQELAQLALDLAKAFRERRVTVIDTIYRMPDQAIRQFADAFRLRKDKDQP